MEKRLFLSIPPHTPSTLLLFIELTSDNDERTERTGKSNLHHTNRRKKEEQNAKKKKKEGGRIEERSQV